MNIEIAQAEYRLEEEQREAENLSEKWNAANEREQQLESAVSRLSEDQKIVEALCRNRTEAGMEKAQIEQLKENCIQRVKQLSETLQKYAETINMEYFALQELQDMGEDVSGSMEIIRNREQWLEMCQNRLKDISEHLEFSVDQIRIVEPGGGNTRFQETSGETGENSVGGTQLKEGLTVKNSLQDDSFATDEDWQIVSKANSFETKHQKVTLEGMRSTPSGPIPVKRDIYQYTAVDPNLKVHGQTNLERMQRGYAPFVKTADGRCERIELHHLTGEEFKPGSLFFNGALSDGSLVELPASTHRNKKHYKALHGLLQGGSFRKHKVSITRDSSGTTQRYRIKTQAAEHYNSFRNNYWKLRAEQFRVK